jgi:hypothetical protein
MSDLSSLSDDQLKALYQTPAAESSDLSKMSDADLMAAHKAAAPKVGVGEDIAKSILPDVASMATGTLGMPGDVGSLIGKGVDYAGSKLGVAPDKVQQFKDLAGGALRNNPITSLPANILSGPTSKDLQSKIEDVTGPLYQPQTVPGQYLKTGVDFLPAMIGGPEGLAAKALTRVALPAVASETAGQLTKGTAAEPYARTAAALLSPAITGAARRAITPFPNVAPERQALADTLRNEGVDLTAGQATGNKPLQWMESALGDTPGSGAPAARVMENQGEQFTSAALRRAGIDAPRATPEVIDNAFTRIGNDFEGVAQRNNVHADQQLGNDLAQTENEYNNVVSPSNRAPVIANTSRDIGDMMAANGGHLTGEQYNAITSRLARQARGAVNDPQLQEGLQGIRTSLDDAMERTLFRTNNQADFRVLRNARNQYRNMMVLEKAATGAGSNAAEGLISPSALRNAVVQQSRRAYGRGQGDFADLSRAGEALLKPLPNSGTSPRHNVTHMMQTIGAVVGGGAGSAGGPAGTALGAAAGLAAPAVAGRALLSRPIQAYLGNQVLQGRPTPDRLRDLYNLMLSRSAINNDSSPKQLPPPAGS